MQNVLFSGCWHYDHNNFLQIRGFDSTTAMNQAILDDHNSKATENTITYCLGDVQLGNANRVAPYIQQMKGKKILVLGNHDTNKNMKKLRHLFDEIHEGYLEVDFHIDQVPRKFVLTHYPLATWNGQYRGSIHLHSHCHNHGVSPYHPHKIDVGLDRCTVLDGKKSYKIGPPLSLQDIANMIAEAEKREYTWLVKFYNKISMQEDFVEMKSPEYEISQFLKWLDRKMAEIFENVKETFAKMPFDTAVLLPRYDPANRIPVYYQKVDTKLSSWRGDL